MVMPSGRTVTCHNCGRSFGEGDCRSWYCSSKCREEDLAKKKALEEQIQAEINKNKPQPPPMYHI